MPAAVEHISDVPMEVSVRMQVMMIGILGGIRDESADAAEIQP